MNWLIFALLSSVFLSARELSVKRLAVNTGPVLMSWGLNLFMCLILVAVNLFQSGLPHADLLFVKVLGAAAVLDALAMMLYLSAIQGGDLSRSIPMLCFIPVVQLFVTPVLVHEQLTLTGMGGVFLVVAGSYLLNARDMRQILAPFQEMARNPGPRKMLCVALLWGISSSFHKIGVTRTSPVFWGMCEMGLISLILLPLVLRNQGIVAALARARVMVLPAVFSVVAVISYYTAIALGPVAYVSSVRRLGVLLTMMVGIVWLKESLGKTAMAGGVIMVAGAAVISIFG